MSIVIPTATHISADEADPEVLVCSAGVATIFFVFFGVGV
jgi:hypothetical protein